MYEEVCIDEMSRFKIGDKVRIIPHLTKLFNYGSCPTGVLGRIIKEGCVGVVTWANYADEIHVDIRDPKLGDQYTIFLFEEEIESVVSEDV